MAFDVQSYLLGLKAGKGGGPTGPISYNDLLDKPFYVEENQLLGSGTLEYNEESNMSIAEDAWEVPFEPTKSYTLVLDSDQQGYTSTFRFVPSVAYLSDPYCGNGAFWESSEGFAYDDIDTDLPFIFDNGMLFVTGRHTSWKIYGPVTHYLDNSYLNNMFGINFEVLNTAHIDIPAGGIDTNDDILGGFFYTAAGYVNNHYYLITRSDGKYLLPLQYVRDIGTTTNYVGDFNLIKDSLPSGCNPDYVQFQGGIDFCIATTAARRTIIQTHDTLMGNIPDSLDISLVWVPNTYVNSTELIYTNVFHNSSMKSLARILNEILLELGKEPIEYIMHPVIM